MAWFGRKHLFMIFIPHLFLLPQFTVLLSLHVPGRIGKKLIYSFKEEMDANSIISLMETLRQYFPWVIHMQQKRSWCLQQLIFNKNAFAKVVIASFILVFSNVKLRLVSFLCIQSPLLQHMRYHLSQCCLSSFSVIP